MHVVLFECPRLRLSLLPLVYTRAVSDFRIGVLTLAEKWAQRTGVVPSVRCAEAYLQPAYPCNWTSDTCFVHAHLCPDAVLSEAVLGLVAGEALYYGDMLLAARVEVPARPVEGAFAELLAAAATTRRELRTAPKLLDAIWRPLDWNAEQIAADIALLGLQATQADRLRAIGLRSYGEHPVFVHESAKFYELTCNTDQGPIYIGKETLIEEGVHIQGPVAVCEGAQLKMGAKLRAGTSIGPGCKVGGEISNSIFFDNSNKAHDGFLGTSILGSWCNIGAGTCCSNLKNNYGEISLWDYGRRAYVKTDRQFCGLFMGDYAKSAIQQAFNTGTVVGPFANVFGAGFPPRQIPAFAWGGAGIMRTYRLEEAVDAASRMMSRRGLSISDVQQRVFASVFEESADLRERSRK